MDTTKNNSIMKQVLVLIVILAVVAFVAYLARPMTNTDMENAQMQDETSQETMMATESFNESDDTSSLESDLNFSMSEFNQ